MEGYVITMREQEGNGVETAVLGIFKNKEDVWHLLFEYYNENKGRFEKQSLNQFENSEGAWEMELVGYKGDVTRTIRGEYVADMQNVTTLKVLIELNW